MVAVPTESVAECFADHGVESGALILREASSPGVDSVDVHVVRNIAGPKPDCQALKRLEGPDVIGGCGWVGRRRRHHSFSHPGFSLSHTAHRCTVSGPSNLTSLSMFPAVVITPACAQYQILVEFAP